MRISAGGQGSAIEAHGLTKRYGPKLAVDDLRFTVLPGRVAVAALLLARRDA
jgi:ABC-type multidrug transport system ATPase subunit